MASKTKPPTRKLIVLKPLVWNGGGYLGPAGSRSVGGFVNDHGYGHEEWNGDPDRSWNGFRIFHTETMGQMEVFGATGDLGMIMTAYRPKVGPVALGVATSVRENSPSELRSILTTLRVKAEGDRVWALPSVRKKFGTRSKFNSHWDREFRNLRWRAPEDEYFWFEEPIPIDPEQIFPSGDPNRPRRHIAKRHGGYMGIRPDQALAIVRPALPASHRIIDWLESPTFDLDLVSAKIRRSKSPRQPTQNSAAPAVTPYVRWLTEQEIAVSPRHHALQSRFKSHIETRCTDLAENRRGVDLQYVCPQRGFVLVEVKPCDIATARFAIRTAIGQLLDYRQSAGRHPRLLIIVEVKPAEERDIELALSNDVAIGWPAGRGFELRWPNRLRS